MKAKNTTPNPTEETYTELQFAYDFFNTKLFGGVLPFCLITLQRKSKCYGYFSPKRFSNRLDKKITTDEIALNPEHIYNESIEHTLSTLVHEMVHLEQAHFGQPSRAGYHNWQWANMMEKVGLIPSHTGKEGGNKVGQQMTHYIEPHGAFERACKQLLDTGLKLSWGELRAELGTKKKKNDRIKYSCPACDLNAWAKPNVLLICGECQEELEAEESQDI